MEKYIEYLRKSQMDRDYDNLSVAETLARHKVELAEFTSRYNINVVEILEEVVSGESLYERPQMMKCLEMINTGEYAGVVCMDIDRLSRGDNMDSGYIMQVLKINNCKIITPGKTYDLNDDSDEQQTDFKFLFSRMEHKTITKRLVRGRKRSTAEGKWVMSVAPYGYTKEKLVGTKGSILKIVPEEARIVQMIFDMYTEQGMGYETIRYNLNQMHIPAKSPKGWSRSIIVNIIKNEAYIGKVKWGAQPVKKVMVDGRLKKRRSTSKTYEVFDGLHEPIISVEQWEKAAKIRTSRTNDSTKIGRELRHTFAGLLYCSKCGKTMKRNVSDHNTAPWYRCQTMGCKCGIIKCDKLEQIVLEQMTDWFSEYMLEINTANIQNNNNIGDALQMVQAQLKGLVEQQNKICDLLEKGVYTISMFQQRNETLQNEINRLKLDEADLIRQVAEQSQDEIEQIIETTQHLLGSYEQLDIKTRNALWKQVLIKITYEKDYGKQSIPTIIIYPKLVKKQ